MTARRLMLTGRNPSQINRNKLFVACNFTDVIIEGISMEKVEFWGCHFNNTTLKDVTLKNCIFKGCLTPSYSNPICFDRTEFSENIKVRSSNLRFNTKGALKNYAHFNEEEQQQIGEAVNYNNPERYNALKKLLDTNNLELLLPLSVVMIDCEWEMKSLFVQKLNKINSDLNYLGKDVVLDVAFTLLSESPGVVLLSVFDLVSKYQPSTKRLESLLHKYIKKIYHSNDGEILKGLQCQRNLLKLKRNDYSFDLYQLNKLLMYSSKEIRLYILEFDDFLNRPFTLEGIKHCLHDPDLEIKMEALYTLGQFKESPNLEIYVDLLRDTSPKIKKEALSVAFIHEQIENPSVMEIISGDDYLEKLLKNMNLGQE